MQKQVKIHNTQPTTHLPAHEREAQRRRAATLRLPAVPGLTPPRKPKSRPQTGRKTTITGPMSGPKFPFC